MLNALYSAINQIIVMLLGFISRAVFLKCLNEEFLGVNSLFTEMLSMLSMADLGMATVMTYSFFKPLVDNDKIKLCQLIYFYKKIYSIIAIVVSVIGIGLIPLLPYLINIDSTINHIYIYYLIFVAKTSASYLFVYKSSILNADQKNYVVTKIQITSKILLTIIQIAVLYLTHSYFIYLISDLVVTIFSNSIYSIIANKYYPFLKNKYELDKKEKNKIFRNIKEGFIYKISSILLTSTDNTLISILVGTVSVGLYSNYTMVLTKISGLIAMVFASLNGSIGNLVASTDADKRYKIYSIVQTIGFITGGIIIVCCYILMEDFVRLWLGSQYILDGSVLLACLLNNYLIIVLQPMWIYRDATGMYRRTKYIMLIAALENIILSTILGLFWGLFGIIIASAISRLTTYIWYEPVILFREFFDRSPKEFFINQGYNIIVIILSMFPFKIIFDKWVCTTWGGFIGKSLCATLLLLIYMLLVYFWRKDFRVVIKYFKMLINTESK